MRRIDVEADGFQFTPDNLDRIREHINNLCRNITVIKKVIISRAKTRRFSDINNYYYNIHVIHNDHSSITLNFEYHNLFLCLELAINRVRSRKSVINRLENSSRMSG